MTQTPASGPCAPVTVPPIACWSIRTASLVCCAPAALGSAKSARVRANATMLPAIADLPRLRFQPRITGSRAAPCQGERRNSHECVADAGPVVDRAFLAGSDRDHQLVPAGVAQRRDPLFQFLLGGGEGGPADQLGGHEAPFLG